MHRNLCKICKGPNFFQNPVMTDDVIAISGPCKSQIFNFEKHSHVIPQKTPKTLLSSYLVLFRSYSAFLLQFSTNQYISKIHCEYFMTSLWRNRICPDSEKSLALYKFCIDYDAKRIRSISRTSFEKKIQNCPSFKKISPLHSPCGSRSVGSCPDELYF